MGCRIQKLMAGSCIWMLLGCSPGYASESVLPGRFDELLESGKKQFFAGHYTEALNI